MKAAVTIVSKNYFSFAQVLAQSFRQHHPDWQFFVVLMDEADGYLTTGVVGQPGLDYEVIEAKDLELPDFGTLVYRYSIMELNTAIKPFVLDHLMRHRGCDVVSYIDPDILFFARMTQVEEALEKNDLCLIPHMRRPFHDTKNPSDLGILQSGTYNLGFAAMRRSPDVENLLAWWMDKLFLDCIVDIPNGLFVDQKWMDLAPGFVEKTAILHDPGHNAAYWNLHERKVVKAESDDGSTSWTVGDKPLVFFHFSGYTPHMPGRLSKHQNRHNLSEMPDLRALCDLYGDQLLASGYDETASWPSAYATLPNGASVPQNLIRNIVQDLLRKGVSIPCPLEQTEAFCDLILQPGKTAHFPEISAFQAHLLAMRPDVESAFPGSATDPQDPDFWNWVTTSGAREENTGDFAELALSHQPYRGLVDIAFRTIWDNDRNDVIEACADMWFDEEHLKNFALWAGQQAVLEGFDLAPETEDAILAAGNGPAAVLNLYFMRGDLQKSFGPIEEPARADAFATWLTTHRDEVGLTCDQITMFREFARLWPEKIQWMRYLYQDNNVKDRALPLAKDHAARVEQVAADLPMSEVIQNILASDNPITPHFVASGDKAGTLAKSLDDDPILQGLKPKTFFTLRKRLLAELEDAADRDWINFAGNLGSRTGMGESARSNLNLLRTQNRPVAVRALPVHDANEMIRKDGQQFGTIARDAACSLTVANADSIDHVRRVLPADYWGKRRIGYWVWETEELPQRFAEAGRWFDEIWTPSAYSAAAIRKTVGETPVHVLPHIVDFEAIDIAAADRTQFGLPKDKTLFGFMFDPKSVLERKNVMGLIEAFLAAVGPEDDAVLVLKSNDRGNGNLDYERIKARAKAHPQRIIFKETFLSREESLSFMKSLDCYVSLHRSEGFGLTCAEAMACGLPVIASGYSGNLDFMSDQNARLVHTPRIQTERAFGPYDAGSHWGNPDLEDASHAIRQMLNADHRGALGLAGKTAIHQTLAPDHVARQLNGLLKAAA